MQWAGSLDEHLVLSVIHEPVHLGQVLVLGAAEDKAPVFRIRTLSRGCEFGDHALLRALQHPQTPTMMPFDRIKLPLRAGKCAWRSLHSRRRSRRRPRVRLPASSTRPCKW